MSGVGIRNILLKRFPDEITIPLIQELENMLQFYHQHEYDLVLVSGGKYVECVFMALAHILTDQVPNSVDLTRLTKELEQQPEDVHQTSIRIIIPRVGKCLYDLRSRRGAVHINRQISPSYMDASLAISMAQWIIAELIRVFSDVESEEIEKLVNSIVDRKLPIVEIIEGFPVILERDISAHESILILLYSHHPKPLTRNEMTEFLTEFTPNNISTSLRNAEKSKLVLRRNDTNYLTLLGVKHVEEKHAGRLFREVSKEMT